MILLCVYYDEFKLQGYFLEPYFFQNIQNIKEDKRALTLLCIKERIGALFLIFFLSKKIWLRKIIYIYLLLFGVVLGILFEIYIIQFGMYGVFLFLASMLPQYIFYLLFFYFYIKEALTNSITIRFISKIIMFLIVGLLIEIYISPTIIKIAIKIYEALYI
ncbi:MAG: hypothetical protein ACRC7V_07755 [Lachnospiraceae bacterium]